MCSSVSKVKPKQFDEDDDPIIFLRSFKNIMLGLPDRKICNQLIACLESNALDHIRGDLDFDWTYKGIFQVFLKEFCGVNKFDQEKLKFQIFKIDRANRESLTAFGKRF